MDCGIDAIGYEAHGHGHRSDKDIPTDALDTIIDVTRYGGSISVPGVYFAFDPKGKGINAKIGRPAFEWGLAWDKGLTISTGQTPVRAYNRNLMTSILFGRVSLEKILNTTVISLDEAPDAYAQFNEGVAKKFVIDPHQVLFDTEKQKAVLAEAGPGSLGREAKWP